MNSKILFKITAAVLALTLAACSIQLRNVKYLPHPLKVMSFKSAPNININLTSSIKQQFKAMGVKWTDNPNAVRLNVVSDQTIYTSDNVLDSGRPSTYTFTETTTFEIDYKGTIIFGPSTLSSSTIMTMTPQAIYAGGTSNVIHQQLNNNIIVLLYNSLIATNTKQAIDDAYKAARKK